MEGRRTAERHDRDQRIAQYAWTLIVVAGDLALFFALGAWDTSREDSFVSNTFLFVASQPFIFIVWVVVRVLIRVVFELLE